MIQFVLFVTLINSIFTCDKFIENLRTDDDLKNFQKNVLLQRNYECLNREHFSLNELKERKENLNFVSLLKNLSPNETETRLRHETCLDYESLKNVSGSDVTCLLLEQMFTNGCNLCPKEVVNPNKEWKIWVYGLSSASVITFSSFSGAFLIPLTRHRYYKRILMFLISLAIGTLCGTGFLHLIPQAYGVSEDINYNYKHMYVWKSLVMIGGLYLFFVVEQILRFFIQFRKFKKSKTNPNKVKELQPINETTDFDEKECYTSGYVYQTEEDALSLRLSKDVGSLSHEINKAHLDLEQTIAPVAWIIIFGEGLHNFIDGLSIGAAFTDSPLQGLSLSLAIICEEFPHKLGDFAILLSAGMKLKVALFCNFISSCFIYVGLFVGIHAGENLDASMWIYAIAGGMFIYIGVCDMIPELGQMANEIEKEEFEWNLRKSRNHQKEQFAVKIKIINMLIQNVGMLLGFGCMLILSLYAKQIQL